MNQATKMPKQQPPKVELLGKLALALADIKKTNPEAFNEGAQRIRKKIEVKGLRYEFM